MAAGDRRCGVVGLARLLAVAAVLGAYGPASAQDPPPPEGPAVDSGASPRMRARVLFTRGQRAVDDRRYADAITDYEACLATDPSAPFAAIARAKAADLRAHAEGGFAPLARFDSVRRDSVKRGDRAEIEALARDLAAFPPGRVRSEARLLVADAFWHAFGEPRRAVVPITEILDDPTADRLTRAHALAELVRVEKELGGVAGALEATRRYPDVAPQIGANLARVARRITLRSVSFGFVALLTALGVASFARAVYRARDPRPVVSEVVRPLSVGVALCVGGAAAVIVRLRGGGNPRPFLLLGLGLLAADIVARAWRVAARDERPFARALRAATCAAGAVAVAFLIFDRTAPDLLDTLGL